MDRRAFVVGGAVAQAQHATGLLRVGYLHHGPPPLPPTFEAFRMGLRNLKWIEGENVVIHHRFAESAERLRRRWRNCCA